MGNPVKHWGTPKWMAIEKSPKVINVVSPMSVICTIPKSSPFLMVNQCKPHPNSAQSVVPCPKAGWRLALWRRGLQQQCLKWRARWVWRHGSAAWGQWSTQIVARTSWGEMMMDPSCGWMDWMDWMDCGLSTFGPNLCEFFQMDPKHPPHHREHCESRNQEIPHFSELRMWWVGNLCPGN